MTMKQKDTRYYFETKTLGCTIHAERREDGTFIYGIVCSERNIGVPHLTGQLADLEAALDLIRGWVAETKKDFERP